MNMCQRPVELNNTRSRDMGRASATERYYCMGVAGLSGTVRNVNTLEARTFKIFSRIVPSRCIKNNKMSSGTHIINFVEKKNRYENSWNPFLSKVYLKRFQLILPTTFSSSFHIRKGDPAFLGGAKHWRVKTFQLLIENKTWRWHDKPLCPLSY